MAEETIQDHIEQTAAGASRVVVDGQVTEAQPLPELIQADKHIARKTAAGSSSLPIRYGQLKPPGTV